VRAGYTCRPTVSWGANAPTGPGAEPITWSPMTKMSALQMSKAKLGRSAALAADILGIPASSPEYTTVHHKGLNVLFGDGSVRTVDQSAYAATQKLIETGAAQSVPAPYYLDDSNIDGGALWNILDRN